MTNHKNGTWTVSDLEMGYFIHACEDAKKLADTFTYQRDLSDWLKCLIDEYEEKCNKMGD